MTHRPIDQHAVRIPQQSGLLPCLYIPVAARDTNAIEKYVGKILAPLARGTPSKALLVEAYEPDKPDKRLAIRTYRKLQSSTIQDRCGFMLTTPLTGELISAHFPMLI